MLPCLESLLASTFHDFEIVLVDDASTDETPAVLARFRDEHPRVPITIVRNEENLGVCGARNAGIDAARGDLVFFTDSDCTVEPDWLERMVAAFDDDALSAVAGTVVDPPPRNWAEMAKFGGSRIGRHRWQGRRLIGGNMGFRRWIVTEHRFDPEIRYGCDEDDLARRLAAAGHRFGFAPEAVVHHHHPFTIGSYLRLAWKQGQGSAHFWRKHGVFLGRDLWFLLAAVLTLPAAWFGMPAALLPAGFLAIQCAALLYNSLAFKWQPLGTALLALPLQLVHSVVKLASVVWAWIVPTDRERRSRPVPSSETITTMPSLASQSRVRQPPEWLLRFTSRLPVIRTVYRQWIALKWQVGRRRFPGSASYWEARYAQGLDSGPGSYGRLAEFKAEFINEFVRAHDITSVVEWGCGDGSQASLIECPKYTGIDIAPTVIERCRKRFEDDSSREFHVRSQMSPGQLEPHELALSLDVIFHLIEDDVYEQYMTELFASASRYVVVYSTNDDSIPAPPQARHRQFTDWVEANAADWELIDVRGNRYPHDPAAYTSTSRCSFYAFRRREGAEPA
ncbi:Putative glycosyltransferase EpsH [Maioricimonas rarisocia]|uniref:Glycosyltransferase EpsH n=1 Tax=Maioricimonas rarisocia TaxID=2528026 RepID=A0A517Z8P4_9PLAN|nr:Putative glycosyltransferase EpsH [Maioricimonas rarisocia]